MGSLPPGEWHGHVFWMSRQRVKMATESQMAGPQVRRVSRPTSFPSDFIIKSVWFIYILEVYNLHVQQLNAVSPTTTEDKIFHCRRLASRRNLIVSDSVSVLIPLSYRGRLGDTRGTGAMFLFLFWIKKKDRSAKSDEKKSLVSKLSKIKICSQNWQKITVWGGRICLFLCLRGKKRFVSGRLVRSET